MSNVRLKGVQHIGVPVSNLEVSLQFYEQVLGVTPNFTDLIEDAQVATAVRVDGARIKIAFLELGNVSLELIEYIAPKGAPYDRRNCDVGAIHVCFEVDDIHAARELLRTKGYDFSTDPISVGSGPLAGYTFAFFKDPDGIQLEFFELPRDG